MAVGAMEVDSTHAGATSPPGPVIVCERLNKSYKTLQGAPIDALVDIDLTIAPGEFISVVGPSGCGKSTLLKIFAGLLPKSSGRLELLGRPIVGPREDIGVVFQNAVLLPWRNVLSNTLLPVEVQGRSREAYIERARSLLKMVGLERFESKYPFELSGGMQQRVAITRALVHDPSILLMDEPFGALDAMTREQMNLDLQDIWLKSRKTVFLITHSIAEAVFLGDRVAVISARPGRLETIIDVNFPRPRSLDLLATPEFGKIVSEIRHLLHVRQGLD
jgi:NitT/TauT family transport system ATP-binding protein